MNAARVLLMAGCISALAALVGCSSRVVYKDKGPDVVVVKDKDPDVVVVTNGKPGPPDHAPAHGYRRNHGDDVELVYDRSLAVYIVNGHSDCYYSAGQFFRFQASTWEWSVDIDGPWKVVVETNDLPPGLHKKHGKGKGKGKKK